jgi:hypothetical protein
MDLYVIIRPQLNMTPALISPNLTRLKRRKSVGFWFG